MANANDTFTEAADTSLVSHTSDSGHTWTKDFGNVLTVNAVGDYLHNAAPTNASRYWLNVTPASAEYDVQADVVSGVNSSMGVRGRVVPATVDEYRAYFSADWKLEKYVGGALTTLGTYAGDTPNGTTRTILLQLRTAAKKLIIGGVERISSADDAVTAVGVPGIFALGNSSTEQMDNWSSTDYVAAGGSFRLNSMLNGLGASGPFFSNALG